MGLPRVHNDTDFVAEPHVLVDRDGEQLCAIVKATFELAQGPPRGADGSFTIAPRERRRRIRAADIPWGKPEVSSILYPSDLCVRKPGTDVIVVARAHAPGGRAVPSFEAGVRLGRAAKTVRVTGARVFLDGGRAVSEPRPVTVLELRWDHAFGGVDRSDPDDPIEDARNPVGRGIARDPESLGGQPAPQIEDPGEPVRDPMDRPAPAGLGPLGRHWEPRRALWGSYGGDWVEKRAPLPPADFDDRASFFAPRELVVTPPLAGGEEGALTNLTPGGGTIAFVLPRLRLEIGFRARGAETVRFTPFVDTVVLDTFATPPRAARARGTTAAAPLTVELTHRAAVPAPARWRDGEIVVREVRQVRS